MSAPFPKTTLCLWYDHSGRGRAHFYARTFPGSSVGAVRRAPGDYPNGKQGDALVVEFTLLACPASGSTAGRRSSIPKPSAFRSQPTSQEETDRYWNAMSKTAAREPVRLVQGQVGPLMADHTKVLTEAIAKGGEAAKRAFAAMMTMKKIDSAAIEAAVNAHA